MWIRDETDVEGSDGGNIEEGTVNIANRAVLWSTSGEHEVPIHYIPALER